jgi:hypothetical protein
MIFSDQNLYWHEHNITQTLNNLIPVYNQLMCCWSLRTPKYEPCTIVVGHYKLHCHIKLKYIRISGFKQQNSLVTKQLELNLKVCHNK